MLFAKKSEYGVRKHQLTPAKANALALQKCFLEG